MFLHLSVSHSVHRGSGLGPGPGGKLEVLPGGCLGPDPWRRLRDQAGGVQAQRVCVQAQGCVYPSMR